MQYQNPDGSFPGDLRVDRIAPHDPVIKGHFMHYILNGMSRAACLMPEEPRLRQIAERLGQFLLRRYRQAGFLPYGDINAWSEPEGYVWRSANPDAIFGFAWLGKLNRRSGLSRSRPRGSRSGAGCWTCSIARKIPDLHGRYPNLAEWRHSFSPPSSAVTTISG